MPRLLSTLVSYHVSLGSRIGLNESYGIDWPVSGKKWSKRG